MIAIHNSSTGFHPRWVAYCEKNRIPFKRVDAYANDIIGRLTDVDAFMWHHHHLGPRDVLFARQLLYSLEHAGIRVFPDFNTTWHFDDKVGQKYLLEAVGAPLVPTHVFYDKSTALDWAESTRFPKVFKLRGGGGATNVKLAKTKKAAISLINRAFGKGFSQYDAWSSLKERFRKYRSGKSGPFEVLKGILRFGHQPDFAKVMGRERGYVYFQDFIPGNDHDIRVIVIGDKAFAIKRMVREHDFRASGSGNILYERHHFDPELIALSFELNDKLKTQCVAYDFVYDNGDPLLIEISYGFLPSGYDPCTGYWDRDLNWHEGIFNPYGWMVDLIK